MKHYMISIYDTKAAAFTPPAFFTAKGLAIRAFSDAIIEKQGNLGKHPEDFQLHCLGIFDDTTGYFEALGKNDPPVLATGSEYMAGTIAAVK